MTRHYFTALAVFAMFVCSAPAWAQGGTTEALTVDSTTGGVGLAAATIGGGNTGRPAMRRCLARLETAQIRYWTNGAAPTTSNGVLLEAGETLILDGSDRIRGLRAIRTTGTSGTLMVECTEGGASVISGGTSGGAGGAVTVTSGTVEVSNLSQDAVAGSTAITSGPQGMGLCDTTNPTAVTDGQAQYIRSDCATGATYTRNLDPCSGIAKTYYIVNNATAGSTEIANAVAGEFWYICSINLVAAAAQTFALAHDDSDSCGSLTAGMNGGNAAATGWSFAANGGIALGNGNATVMKSATANHYLCYAIGQSVQISGTIAYVSAP